MEERVTSLEERLARVEGIFRADEHQTKSCGVRPQVKF